MSNEATTRTSPYAFAINDEVLFNPSAKQEEALTECLSGKYPNIFVWGNRGGGKSWMARNLAHMLAMTFPNFRYQIVRRRLGELQENHTNYLTRALRGAYIKVVGPKLAADRNKLREEVIREINSQPRSTSAPSLPAKTPTHAGPFGLVERRSSHVRRLQALTPTFAPELYESVKELRRISREVKSREEWLELAGRRLPRK